MKIDRNNKPISIDFDGVLHKCSKGYQNGEIYDEPTEGAAWTCHNLAKKFTLIVMTARPKKEHKMVEEWLDKHGFPKMLVTNKKYNSRAYIDDRAIRFTAWHDVVKYFL